MRTDRTRLPEELREAVQAHTGPITAIEAASTGNHADLASTLHTPQGRVFVKAARKLADRDGPEVRSLRWEAAINPHVTEFAPRLLWQVEAGGWLALGFEHLDARHADYSPGSPDLELLAKTVHALQATPRPDVLASKPVERRWETVTSDAAPMSGDALLHTDVNADNLLVTPDGRARLVDWAFVATGAPWVELGLVIPWLLKGGHTPAEAEQWASRFPSWPAADPAHLDLFACALAARWRQHAARDDAEDWVLLHAALTGQWAKHRGR